MAEKGRLFTGARARFSINGVRVGYATSVNVTEETSYEEVAVLGNVEVEEYAPTGYRVTFTARQFRIIGDTLRSRGWLAKIGKDSDEHLTNILNSRELTATIEDTKTSKLFAVLEQVQIASHSWTVDARGVVGEDVTFNAIRVKDESET